MKLIRIQAEKTMQKVYNEDFKNEAKKRKEDFTRNRKMKFEDLMLYMLLSLKNSTATALRRFFVGMNMNVFMTQQSLSEARTKVNVWAFEELFNETAETMIDYCHNRWHGYRILAIDGTKIQLPTDKKLRAYYGALGKDKTAPTAQASILYDVLNDIVCDAAIKPMKIDERTLAKGHIKKCNETTKGSKNLIIFDRGYPSFELIEMLEKEGISYLMRVRNKFNNDIDTQSSSDGIVFLEQNDKRIQVRVIKFTLDSGEEEVLVTNITDRRLRTKAFKKLYFLRWPIETKYDIVKNKLQLENFNTRTIEGIQQDFFATMYLTNIAASALIDVQDDIDSSRNNKGNKYQYKANLNELIGILKDRFVFAIAQDSPDDQWIMIDLILQEVQRHVVSIKPDRSTTRNSTPRKAKFHHNQKTNC
jgi:hypothetical protein